MSRTTLALPSPAELELLPEDGGPNWNRLVFESSPYLLQHAANPVDWLPWSAFAFERAQRENRPIFLSIGYATCHWCHVMAHESFEDPEVADYLNRHFVSIKVDKEERPEIDDIYMSACQLMTGSGGWPLTALLTHDRLPFFAGTYFPKRGRAGRMGLLELLARVVELWNRDRDGLLADAERMGSELRRSGDASWGELLGEQSLEKAVAQLVSRYDESYGGFGERPKFPTPHNLLFLLRRRNLSQENLNIVTHSLEAMRMGGIFDHIGFGFHRYSTDEHWLLPHFEKMLYDQALLAIAYLEAYQVSARQDFAQAACEIFTYVQRDMTSADGGFYSAEDADSEGVEGKFYLWSHAELAACLGDQIQAFCSLFAIQPGGNFRDEHTGKLTGLNIPHYPAPFAQLAERLALQPEALASQIESWRKQLFAQRELRIHPLKDDKILTDWNGLMIAAFARGAQVIRDPAYLLAANRAADFVWRELRDDKGRLFKRSRLGKVGLQGQLDDYAFLIWGLLELYQAGLDPFHLESALQLVEQVELHFADPTGGYFLTPNDGEPLILRAKRIYDGAIPSGNSVMAHNLVKLWLLLGDESLRNRAEALIQAFAGKVAAYPTMSCMLMMAVELLHAPSRELVIVGQPGRKDTEALLETARARPAPYLSLLLKAPDDSRIERLAPFTKDQVQLGGKATAYLCQNGACQLPTTDPMVLAQLLAN